MDAAADMEALLRVYLSFVGFLLAVGMVGMMGRGDMGRHGRLLGADYCSRRPRFGGSGGQRHPSQSADGHGES
jgi:hypothetical protein